MGLLAGTVENGTLFVLEFVAELELGPKTHSAPLCLFG